MFRCLPLAGLMAAIVVAGCATPAPETTAAKSKANDQRCQQVTGSSICRAEGSGRMANVQSISGENLQRSPDPMAGPRPVPAGN